MITHLPAYVSFFFALTTVATVLLFYWTVKNSGSETTRKSAGTIRIALTVWLVIQAVLALNNLYNTGSKLTPPKILLFGILPPLLTIGYLFASTKGKQFIDSLPLKNLTYLNVVRIPVELVLYWLFVYKAVPQLMTFEGRNFDIISGITAPFIAYFGFTKGKLSRQVILIWNVIGLALLTNIVVNALLSAPSPLQKFGFDQPNIAIGNFPFCWLPTCIVPLVLFGHLASIRQLSRRLPPA